MSRDIIVEASEGNIEAFESIYRETSDFVYNIALKMTGNREDAEEITQDVFLKIYKNLKRFKFHSSFRTWVYRIAVNTAIDAVKRKARGSDRMVEYDDSIKSKKEFEAKDTEMERERNEELVRSLLVTLNPDQRACIVLRNIEGLSYEEIARTLKVNINTVRTRLKRARERLLANFKEEVKNNEM